MLYGELIYFLINIYEVLIILDIWFILVNRIDKEKKVFCFCGVDFVVEGEDK